MRIEYDDDVLNIISSVNDELKKYHLKFQIEDGDKDGFELFELVRIKKKFIINAKPFELHANFLSYDNLVDLAEKSGYPTIACSVPGSFIPAIRTR